MELVPFFHSTQAVSVFNWAVRESLAQPGHVCSVSRMNRSQSRHTSCWQVRHWYTCHGMTNVSTSSSWQGGAEADLFVGFGERFGAGETVAGPVGRAGHLVEGFQREQVVVGAGQVRRRDQRQRALLALDGQLAVARKTLRTVVAAARQRRAALDVHVAAPTKVSLDEARQTQIKPAMWHGKHEIPIKPNVTLAEAKSGTAK